MNGLNGLLGKVGKEQNTETLEDSKNRFHSMEEGVSCFYLKYISICVRYLQIQTVVALSMVSKFFTFRMHRTMEHVKT